MKWTERSMQAALSTTGFLGGSVLVIPNCSWAGDQKDMLIIEPNLRIVDVEIKVSRADLKADLKKTKWWKSRPWSKRHLPRERREWPDKVWKHYYAFPRELWTDDLEQHLPASSGILLVYLNPRPAEWNRGAEQIPGHGFLGVHVQRRAKPNKQAKPICPADVVDLARLTSLRAWALIRDANRISMTQPTT